MSAPKWTAGPWKACFPVGNEPFVSNEGTVVVNKVGPLGESGIFRQSTSEQDLIDAKDYQLARQDLRKANARLIAAAPEMAEALEAGLAVMQVLADSRAKWSHRNQAAFDKMEAALRKAQGEV